MNNAEYMRLLKAQRERAKMKESEVVEALKIKEHEPNYVPETPPAPEPEPTPEPIQEPDTDNMEDADNGTESD